MTRTGNWHDRSGQKQRMLRPRILFQNSSDFYHRHGDEPRWNVPAYKPDPRLNLVFAFPGDTVFEKLAA